VNITEATMKKNDDETMDRDNVSAERALFTIDDVQLRVASVVDALAPLVADLRARLPAGPAADVAPPSEDLSRKLREVVAECRVDRVRGAIMDHAVAIDEVACASCDSPDFSNEGCEACRFVRSDGARFAQRVAGWLV
jgi:hypothetical protein